MIHGTYVGNGQVLVRTTWNGRFVLPADDRSFLPWLLFDGVIEEPATRYVLEHVGPGERVLDVGAAFGYYSVLFGHLVGDGGKVVALEPNPELFEILLQNLALNSVRARVRPVPMAAADAPGEVALHVTETFKGNSSLRKHGKWYQAHYGDRQREVLVKAVAIDEAFAGETFDLVKMDIEGGEFKALAGAAELLERGKIRRILFELNKPMLGPDWAPLRRLLAAWEDRCGATYHLLDPAGRPHPAALKAIFEQDYVPAVLMAL